MSASSPAQHQKTLAHLNAAIESIGRHGRGTIPSDPFNQFEWEMAGAHGLILIGLKNIYVKARTVDVKDHRDFVLYALFWVHAVEHHHGLEEEWFFASLKGAIAPEQIVSEHDGFRTQLHDMQEYLTGCLPSGTKWGFEEDTVNSVKAGNKHAFDGARLEVLIEKLVEVFLDHFSAEPGYLTSEKLRPFLSYEEITAIKDRLTGVIMSKPKSFHVYSYIHRPTENFPPMPWFVKLLCNWVWYWPDRNMWRFVPKLDYGVSYKSE